MQKKHPKPGSNGKRFRCSANLAVYLVDRGVLRHIPNQTTFGLLFGDDWANVLVDDPEMDLIPLGRPFAEGTFLAKAANDGDLYLVSPLGVKRRITTQNYRFAESRARTLAVDELDSFLEGPPLE